MKSLKHHVWQNNLVQQLMRQEVQRFETVVPCASQYIGDCIEQYVSLMTQQR